MRGVVALVAVTSAAALREEEVAIQREADYSESGSNWGGECSGGHQSPINLVSTESTSVPVDVFGYRYHDVNELSVEVVNSALTALVSDAGGVQYNSNHHALDKITVHSPAEHTIDGMRYPLEVQLHHQTTDKNRHSVIVSVLMESPGNPPAAHEVAEEGEEAFLQESVSVQESTNARIGAGATANLLQKLILRPDLYELEKKVNAAEEKADRLLKSRQHHRLQLTTAMLHTKEDGYTMPSDGDEGFNPALQCLVTVSPPGIEDVTPVALEKASNFNDLLADQVNYYQYSGSFTSQPCTETVSWLVSTTPVMASDAQIEVLRGHADLLTNRLGNARKVSQIGNRLVSILQSELIPASIDAEEITNTDISDAEALTKESMETARELDRRIRAAAVAGNATLVAALRGEVQPLAPEQIAPVGAETGAAGEAWIKSKMSEHMAKTVKDELKKQLRERVAPEVKAAADKAAANPPAVANGGLRPEEQWPWPTTASKERKFKNIPCEAAGGCPDGEEMQEIIPGLNDDATLAAAEAGLEAAENDVFTDDEVQQTGGVQEVTGHLTDAEGSIVSPSEVTVSGTVTPPEAAAFLAWARRVGNVDNL